MNSPAPIRLYTVYWTELSSSYSSKLYPRSFTSAREWLADEIARNKKLWGRTQEEIIMYGVVETDVRLTTSLVWITCLNHEFVIRPATTEEIKNGKEHGDTNQFL